VITIAARSCVSSYNSESILFLSKIVAIFKDIFHLQLMRKQPEWDRTNVCAILQDKPKSLSPPEEKKFTLLDQNKESVNLRDMNNEKLFAKSRNMQQHI